MTETASPTVGVIFRPESPPEDLRPMVRAAEDADAIAIQTPADAPDPRVLFDALPQ
ncbi:hypothetical protein [Microbacterium amylolyticum]|uniref:Uncharacterized protein n=1 Tax=Microbacterium amylolyticum TaxID=936337 RepID=A0ABS4ZHE7_9MICO|nr:hypothetical protein [Microbacterium amylolyticum]MBP2436702.1 hypothetical protein [Microbacterium amylolyticum]